MPSKCRLSSSRSSSNPALITKRPLSLLSSTLTVSLITPMMASRSSGTMLSKMLSKTAQERGCTRRCSRVRSSEAAVQVLSKLAQSCALADWLRSLFMIRAESCTLRVASCSCLSSPFDVEEVSRKSTVFSRSLMASTSLSGRRNQSLSSCLPGLDLRYCAVSPNKLSPSFLRPMFCTDGWLSSRKTSSARSVCSSTVSKPSGLMKLSDCRAIESPSLFLSCMPAFFSTQLSSPHSARWHCSPPTSEASSPRSVPGSCARASSCADDANSVCGSASIVTPPSPRAAANSTSLERAGSSTTLGLSWKSSSCNIAYGSASATSHSEIRPVSPSYAATPSRPP